MSSPETKPGRGLLIGGLALGLVALLVAGFGIASRSGDAVELRARAEAQSVPTVVLVSPMAASAAAVLELPGRIEAQARAPIYARVSGYLKSWQADIGAKVRAGQQLAEIETPELDQQLLQAQAELASAKSSASLAASTAKRWASLVAIDSVSRQEADEKAGDAITKQSVVNGLQANVERIQALKRFSRVVAPFDGVVTARNTDIGALINVGGSPGSELFVVSDLRKLRVYVSVPQAYVSALKAGSKATLSVPEQRGKTYPATVQALSSAISSGSGSMLVQLSADQGSAELLAGGFASVSFNMPATPGTLSIPPSSLIYGKAGLRVATVGADNKVLIKPVQVARDLGTSIELAGGLNDTDRLIESPPDGVENGDPVRVAAAAKK